MSKTRQRKGASLSEKKFLSVKSRSRLLHRTLAFALMISPVSRVLAQPWFLPTEGVDSVFLKNTSNVPQMLWLDAPNNPQNPVREMGISLAPNEEKSISLSALKSQSWVQIKSYLQVPVMVSANIANNLSVSIPGRSDTSRLPAAVSEDLGSLKIANLSANAQELVVQKLFQQQVTFSFSLKLDSYESAQMLLNLKLGEEIVVQAQYPIASFWQGLQQTQFLAPSLSQQKFNVDPNETYFLMGNSKHTQSFVIHSHDAKIITQSRYQIANLPENRRKILIAKIGFGHDDNNRDFLGLTHNAWSWNVSQVLEYGDLGSQDCDGSPSLVEDNLKSWISAPGGICFWNYKLIRELSPDEVSSGALNSPN